MWNQTREPSSERFLPDSGAAIVSLVIELMMSTTNPIQIKPGDAGRLIMFLPYSSERASKVTTNDCRRWHQQEKHWASIMPDK